MIEYSEIATRLALAALFGAIVGLERERKNWAAGIRTHMLVSVGAALTMIVSTYGFMDVLSHPQINLDPSRVAAQVISGIGFIGAGTILFLKQGIVRGLTTAAGLWTVAAIGLATGGGMYFAASLATGLAIIILFGLQFIEKKVTSRFKQKKLKITTSSEAKSLKVINYIFKDNNLSIASCSVNKVGMDYIIFIALENITSIDLSTLINEIQADGDVQEVHWA